MPDPKFRFVHAADVHLDTPFAAIGRAAPAIAERLRDASLEAFDALVRMAIEREAAFVVFAGDLHDAADRGVRSQLRFLRGVERLGECGIRVFVAHGNHDPLDGWSAMRRAPANLTVFGAEAVEAHPVMRGGDMLAQVYGISYPRRDVTANLSLLFRRQDTSGLHVGVLHCNVGAQPDHLAYSPCSIADLTAAGMDYWALGHIHRHLRLAEGRPWIVYPGSLQAGKSSEVGPRGAVLVEAAGSAVERVDFVELDRIRFTQVEIDISNETDLHSLRGTILKQAVREERDLLLTVQLSGRGPLHRDLRRPGALADLVRDVRDELGVASPFVWVDRILDQTRPELDRETIRRRGDFSSDLTRLVDGLRADPEALRSLAATLSTAAQFDAEGPEDLESLLREAEERALDLLESEQQR
jgi:DNA repair exonuclease SbcCD nuclease subunit